jgi:hypothetical protein
MVLKNKKTLSAEIVLRPASGKAFDTQTAITSENIAEYLPSPDTVAAAQRAFTQAGFDVGNAVGMSFSITAPASTFEKVFKVKIAPTDRGGVKARVQGGAESYELPITVLPKEIAKHIVAATFSRPPDFGPGNF